MRSIFQDFLDLSSNKVDSLNFGCLPADTEIVFKVRVQKNHDDQKRLHSSKETRFSPIQLSFAFRNSALPMTASYFNDLTKATTEKPTCICARPCHNSHTCYHFPFS